MRLFPIISALLLFPVLGEAGKRVLFLGDSMSMGAFGRTLDQDMRDAGHDVFTFVTGGGSPYYWLGNQPTISCSIGHWEKTPTSESRVGYVKAVPKVESLMDRYEPDVVVVQTGTNLYTQLRSKRRTKEGNIEEVQGVCGDLFRGIAERGARVYWISPPHAHERRYPEELQRELFDITNEVLQPFGKAFDSHKVTSYDDPHPENDGIHYGPTEAKEWAGKVSDDLVPFIESCPPRGEGGAMGSTEHLIAVNTVETDSQPLSAQEIRLAIPLPQLSKYNSQTVLNRSSGDQKSVSIAKIPRALPIANLQSGRGDEEEARPLEAVSNREFGPVTVELRLSKKSMVNHLSDVTYRSAFAVYEYDVVRIADGRYPFGKIRVAHMVVMNQKFTSPAHFKLRDRFDFELVPMSDFPRLAQIQRFDDLAPDFSAPLFICKF